MQSIGVQEEEIAKFADPKHWLQYFPPMTQEDLSIMGAKVNEGRVRPTARGCLDGQGDQRASSVCWVAQCGTQRSPLSV